MAITDEKGHIRILAMRGGTIGEITSFLYDIEKAYNQIYLFETFVLSDFNPRLRRYSPLLEFGVSLPNVTSQLSEDLILPEYRLFIEKVSIQSPGFWEVFGSLNPLQQIREFLNDRHKRRQDREYKEEQEKKRLILENELIQRQIYEKDNAWIRERIQIMKELGCSEQEIKALIWANYGKPLAELGKHQDSGLIGGVD